jgi:hypothetical protein
MKIDNIKEVTHDMEKPQKKESNRKPKHSGRQTRTSGRQFQKLKIK